MSEFTVALGLVAPWYNLGLVVISLWLFVKLFSVQVRQKGVYLKPWKFIFAALIIYILEEGLTVLRSAEILNIPQHINGFFEVSIITLFIYTLLLQEQYIKKTAR